MREKKAARVEMKKEVFDLVAPLERVDYEGGPLKIALVDVGAKDNMVRSLLGTRGVSVRRIPWTANLARRGVHTPMAW